MGELLPTLAADSIRRGLLEYLETTFSLSDVAVRDVLRAFLDDPESGIFRGAFLRMRLPFRPAAAGWTEALSWWPQGFTPYGHQAAAFARLGSGDLSEGKPAPLPTLVTTGTGSGKTEAFLYPILDHVLRAKARGEAGTKALILYPMNALANDQAQRLAGLISSDPRLDGVTAALYTGQGEQKRTRVTAEGLIEDRAIMRSSAPDILLTNYKMLDHLLLRRADQPIWKQSAASLQYLVLDEFHTYDGAQGTDVAMLLRRLRMALRAYGRDEDAALTPVATSATLGEKGDPSAMLAFAEDVFGVRFPADAVVTESRVEADDWSVQPRVGAPVIGSELVKAVNDVLDDLGPDPEADELGKRMLRTINENAIVEDAFKVKSHPVTRQLLEATVSARSVPDLAAELFPDADSAAAERAFAAYVGMLSHLRKTEGRSWPSVELHLWIRELTRIDREVAAQPAFFWADDGAAVRTSDDSRVGPLLPAIFCRHCGRSGWMLRMSPANETDLDLDDENIRAAHVTRSGRTRPVLYAGREGEAVLSGAEPEAALRWFHVAQRQVLMKAPEGEAAHDGSVIPVMTHVADADEASAQDRCPSCLQRDGIRFLGSAIATQLSVALSTLFGSTNLDSSEKKTLVFTDSVQDAAHRAGFVQSRSHSLTVRSMLRAAVGSSPVSLDLLADRVIAAAGDDASLRFRILPPDLAEHEIFAPFWQTKKLAKVPLGVRNRVRKRVAFDAVLEFGLQSQFGRTLQATGSVGVEVDAAARLMVRAARDAVDEAGGTALLGVAADDRELTAWVRGVLERMRERGSIEHEWFRNLIKNDGNRHWIWRGRARSEGMPAFPTGRSGPAYPRIGKAVSFRDPVLDAVTGAQAWYTDWTRRSLKVSAQEASSLVATLMRKLAAQHLVNETVTATDARVYSIPQGSVVIEPLTDDYQVLACPECQTQVPGTPRVIGELVGAPCSTTRCKGRLVAMAGEPGNFYRRFYASHELQRVIAREHTSLLPDDVRLRYENGFKTSVETAPNAPNVLVATPTLEMGIDIGDLSTVMLASLPRTVASYVQRIGRGGRLTGSALGLAFVTARGEQLPLVGDPLSMINGEVRPPATYLDAEEILRRQLIASIADRIARDPDAPHPDTHMPGAAKAAMEKVAPGSWLHEIAARAESSPDVVEEFLAGFAALDDGSAKRLREWATRTSGPLTSELAERLVTESQRWRHDLETVAFRIAETEKELPVLERQANSPAATEEDKHHFQSANAALRLARKHRADLQGEYWIAVAERAGLLPNYTLMDDSVTLDVALRWMDPESGAYETDSLDYHRNAALALREFAPRARFYARGYRVEIDAVDLGAGGEAVRTYAFCPVCGFRADVTSDAAPSACPRCAAGGMADVRQRLDVVELTRASSVMRRDEAGIDDSSDERERVAFDERFIADIDPAKVTRQWYVADYGFGVKHLRNMDLTWLNLGRRSGHGSTKVLGGHEVDAELFRVCGECGKLDQETSRNSRYEHRPWCRLRESADESAVSIALSRSLVTEGLVLRLPPMTSTGNAFAVPSLEAALKLGLREHIGGAPDHLSVESVVDTDIVDGHGGLVYDALLLHDLVPGGTGYLIDLAEPSMMRTVLQQALTVVAGCACGEEGRLACHRCLLPFARPGDARLVSRSEAERLLGDLLSAGTNQPLDAWTVTDVPVVAFDPESKMEQLFRKRLVERLGVLGATVKEHPSTHGIRYDINVGGRHWSLDPQVQMGHTQPDFVLRTADPNILPMVIYCDGWRWHASPKTNRIAEDAENRRMLRESGNLVVGLSWTDLETSENPGKPSWYDAGTVIGTANQMNVGLKPEHVDVIGGSAMDLIIWWIQNADLAGLQAIGKVLPFLVAGPAQVKGDAGSGDLTAAAVDLLAGKEMTGSPSAWAWCEDTLVWLNRFDPTTYSTDVVLVLDDENVGPEHKEAWQSWLRYSNLLGARTTGTAITARTLAGATGAEILPGIVEGPKVDAVWGPVLEMATPSETALMNALRDAGVDQVPELGHEVGGVPVFAFVDHRIVVDVDGLDEEDRNLLSAEGWQVVSASLDEIQAALNGVSH